MSKRNAAPSSTSASSTSTPQPSPSLVNEYIDYDDAVYRVTRHGRNRTELEDDKGGKLLLCTTDADMLWAEQDDRRKKKARRAAREQRGLEGVPDHAAHEALVV